MPKHKSQRVGVFVDVQNLYYSAKQFYNSKVNFAHILKKAVDGRELVRAIAYVIKADIKEEHNFFEALEKIGYDVRSKDLQTFYTGAKKGDWDVGIAMDIMRMAAKLDVIVLVSGDGDFKDLLEHVKALGCRAEVVAFGKTASSRLLNEADEMTDLGKELDRVLIRDRQGKELHGGIEQQGKEVASGSDPNVKQDKPYSQPAKPQFNRGRKPRFQSERREGFQRKRFQHDDGMESEASLLQKINMDQPDLKRSQPPVLAMPREEPPKIEIPPQTKEEISAKTEDTEKKAPKRRFPKAPKKEAKKNK